MIDAEKLKRAMEKEKLDSFGLSVNARVPQATIYRTLTRRSVPQTETLMRICRALHLKVDDVLLATSEQEAASDLP